MAFFLQRENYGASNYGRTEGLADIVEESTEFFKHSVRPSFTHISPFEI